MPTDVDDWYTTDPREYMPDHRVRCKLCGEPIEDDEVYTYYADDYHRECLKEVFEEEAQEEINARLSTAHKPRC